MDRQAYDSHEKMYNMDRQQYDMLMSKCYQMGQMGQMYMPPMPMMGMPKYGAAPNTDMMMKNPYYTYPMMPAQPVGYPQVSPPKQKNLGQGQTVPVKEKNVQPVANKVTKEINLEKEG